jgi:alpha-glucosidase
VGRLNSRGSEAASEHVNKAVMMEAVTIQMTWPGAPTIYYGDEVGLCGWTDPDNRRPFPWGREDKLLLDFHREIIKIHKQYPVFREGSVKKLKSEYNLIVYGRFTEDEQMIIAVNNNPDEKTVKIPVWQIGFVDGDDCEQVIATYENGYSTEPLGYSVNKGMLTLGLRKTSAVVLKKKVW